MNDSCPVCSERRVEAIATANPYYRLLRCDVCKHTFVSPADLTDQENKDVQLAYFDENFADRNSFFITLYERLNARRAARALDLKRRSCVLEIGPGSGAVMAWLANLGHDVRGLDLSPAVAQRIEQRWQLPVAVETLNEHVGLVGEEAYDAIIMCHVLEHFRDPLRSLQSARAALKPGGKLYIAVPNMGSWHRCFRGWTGYEPYHVHYFRDTSLSLVLSRAGFEVKKTMSFESLTGWVNTLMRSITALEVGQASVRLYNPGLKRRVLEWLRLVIGVLLSPLRWMQARLGRGEELVAICVRPRA